jgi:hypothetical protein
LIFCNSFIYFTSAKDEWKQRKFVFANGGRTIASKNGQLRGTLGQALIGNNWVSTNKSGSGFWYEKIAQIDDVKESIEFGTEHLFLYPNPTANLLLIKFNLAQPAKIKYEIIDILGNVIINLDEQQLKNGEQLIYIDCLSLLNGLYFVRLYVNVKCLCEKFSIIK